MTRCIFWNENDQVSGWQDDIEARGNLFDQYEYALQFLRKNLHLKRNISGNRKEEYDIPLNVIEEAIANALVHRKYWNRNEQVQIELFENRLEIKSPGGLPSPMTIEGLGIDTATHPRNPGIARIFYLSGLVERIGSSIKRIISIMHDAGLPPPEFDLSPNETFRVILRRPQTKVFKDLKLPQKNPELLAEYLKDVIAGTSHIDIHGISSASAAGRKSIRFPIEEHYTSLKTMSNPMALKETSMMDGKAFDEARRVPLTNLLSSCPRLLIVGEPGGGKTTFLRFIACVLAKDALGQDKPGRHSHLGLTLDEPPPIPILIRLSVLAGILKKGCPASHGSSAWRVLVQAMEELFETETVFVLKGLLDEGRCALLLDGLDEEPDMNIREKMVEVTNAVLHHWGRNLIVITSPPFGYQAVTALEEMKKAEIDAFSEAEILEFLSRWASALFPDEDERNRRAYLPELRSAVLNVSRIKRMAKNPVMLTCLCVVHWNEKKLPEGKADLLAAVLRWLVNAKEEKRKARGYHNTFAVECFKALAFSMTNNPKGKQVSADLSWAAEQLKVPFRDELNVYDEYSVRKRGMEFLEAETIDSGIIEQVGAGQVRFWALTFQEYYKMQESS